MDPSALIFIALAAAWAIYLIPKALEHHEESVRTRTVEKFSATIRVLARREPVSRRRARLVRTGATPKAPPPAPATASAAPAPTIAAPVRRSAAATAARRRFRVLAVILLAVAVVVVLAAFSVVTWPWVTAPVAVLVAWLVACRMMVKRERASSARRPSRPAPRTAAAPVRAPVPAAAGPEPDVETTGTVDIVPADDRTDDRADDRAGDRAGDRPDPTDPQSWDPVPVTLPTYVSKSVAPRSVRQIDLDSTGVWTSGRSESDSELVRESRAREAGRDAEGSTARRRRA